VVVRACKQGVHDSVQSIPLLGIQGSMLYSVTGLHYQADYNVMSLALASLVCTTAFLGSAPLQSRIYVVGVTGIGSTNAFLWFRSFAFEDQWDMRRLCCSPKNCLEQFLSGSAFLDSLLCRHGRMLFSRTGW
jgi:hypothetical protein